MLSTSNLKSAQAATYFEKDDYYSQSEGPSQSRWVGQGAERLHLSGSIEQETFQKLLRGKSPEGQLLFSRRLNPSTRRAATDYTFSAPKSVSVAALVQGDRRVIQAHHMAVDRTLKVLEERYTQTRVTTETGRQTLNTGNLIAAVFPHGTSREAEPQLHSHCVVMNATQLENGIWYSVLNDSAIMNKKLLGQIYQNELAFELKKIGYEITQRDHGQFDIKGYSPELLATFSTRRAQIEALVAEWKASGKTVRDAEGYPIRMETLLREVANLQTRKVKPQIVEAEKLLQNWQAVIAMKGLSLPELPGEQAIGVSEGAKAETLEAPATLSPALSQAVTDGIAHCGERDAIFRTTAIEKFVFEHHIGELSIEQLQQAIASHPELITVEAGPRNSTGNSTRKGTGKDTAKVTTQSALQLELTSIRLMQQAQGQVGQIASAETVGACLEPLNLSPEQHSAISLSCHSADQFIGWQGAAGTGKTFALSALKEIAVDQGYEVSGYAPSAAAAHELGESLRIETNTVARLLLEASLAPDNDLTERRRRRKLWLIDEAGLLSMREAQALLTRATEEEARVIFVGDTRQLSAVEAGNPFRSLQAGGMLTAHLDQARRQQQAQLRQAVQLISQGAVNAGIQVLERAGCISEIDNTQARGERLVSDYLNLEHDERQKTLLLSGTNANRLALTAQVRQGLQAEGSLGQNVYTMESLQRKDLTQVQDRYASSYETGDILVPVRHYKRQGLAKNEHYRVRAVDTQTNTLTLETTEQLLIQVNPALCEKKAVYRVLTAEIAAGDLLKWTKNNRIADTRNGQQFTVKSITPEGIAQTINDDGEQRTLDLTGAQHIDYAWVSTTYSSQGKTASNVMALIDSTTNKEAFYVATSRAKNRVQLYTSSLDDLQLLAERSRANENVSDYIPLFELAQAEISPYEISTEISTGISTEISPEIIPNEQPHEPITATPTTAAPISAPPTTNAQTPADYARETPGTADRRRPRRHQAAGLGNRTAAGAARRTRELAVPNVAELRAVLAGIAELRRLAELSRATVWIAQAAQRINDSARQLALAAAGITRLYEQVGQQLEQQRHEQQLEQQRHQQRQLERQLEQQQLEQQRHEQQLQPASPALEALRETPNPEVQTGVQAEVQTAVKTDAKMIGEIAAVAEPADPPSPAPQPLAPQPQVPQLLTLQPPAPEASLTQQLDAFASTLGYEPGDRLYVRSLLPKHLPDDLALKHGLKFEVEENGQKRLIPNTRRGYLTVGSWEFTHLRKDKEPVVYPDGLAQLAELNQQGRGIYFVVNPGGERDNEITQARSLFWENDTQTKAQQLQQVRTAGLPVGAIVETHQSIHCYSPLETPLQDLSQWTQLQERLIQRMDSDPAIRNSSRLMRLPGFDHVRVQDDELMFSPVTLRHVAPAAKTTVEAIDAQLPQWDDTRWQRQAQSADGQPAGQPQSTGVAAIPTLPTENPWDIRNFAAYLNGDQRSHNGWLQVQCPEHGGDGHSGNSLHINESTGQYKCHGGCDSQAVYDAASKLAESRGWQPPKQKTTATTATAEPTTTTTTAEPAEPATQATAAPIPPAPSPTLPTTTATTPSPTTTPTPTVPETANRPLTRWERYSSGLENLPDKQRDFQVAKRAFSDGFSKKQVISLLAQNSRRAQKLYHDEGSTPAYNYVSFVVSAAQRQSAQAQAQVRSKAKGVER